VHSTLRPSGGGGGTRPVVLKGGRGLPRAGGRSLGSRSGGEGGGGFSSPVGERVRGGPLEEDQSLGKETRRKGGAGFVLLSERWGVWSQSSAPGPGLPPGPGPGPGPAAWCSTPCCSCPAAAAPWAPGAKGPPGRSPGPSGRGQCAGRGGGGGELCRPVRVQHTCETERGVQLNCLCAKLG